MEKLSSLAEWFVEDVNEEDSAILELFGRTVHILFGLFMVTGIPFLLYVLLQFGKLI